MNQPRLYLILMGLLSLGVIQTANSASYDCKKSSTWVEKTICSTAELSKLDEKMAKQYHNEITESVSSEAYIKSEQFQWLKYQRNTCKTKECLVREYQEKINGEAVYGKVWDYPSELKKRDLPMKSAYGRFTKDVKISVYNPDAKDKEDIFDGTNRLTINQVATKPYVSIVGGSFIFRNAHECSLGDEKAKWSENHWLINNYELGETCELRLYPANGKVLIRDIDSQCRKLYCGMRGYFNAIILEQKK